MGKINHEFIIDNIKVHFMKTHNLGKYFIASIFPVEIAPDENKERREFYKKDKIGKKIDLIEKLRDEKKFNTIKELKLSVGEIIKKFHLEEIKKIKMVRYKYGVIENKGNGIFFDLGCFDTFEEAVEERKSSKLFTRKDNEIVIVQRVEVKNE